MRLGMLLACLLLSAAARAETYPNRPVKFVVPFPPGGNLDFVARTLQPRMQEVLGQPVIIDNRGGAAGMIGLEYASKQAAEAVAKLSQALNAALAQADVKEKFAAAGLDTVSSTPAEFAAFIRGEIAKWGKVAREVNIRIDP